MGVTMVRAILITPFLIIGLAMSARAQQPDNQDKSILNAWNKAALARDAAGLAALYTKDAVVFTPDGPVYGRAAIEKMYARELQHIKENPSKVEQVTAIGDTVRLRGGSWSGARKGEKGPVYLKGYWTATDVRVGNTWKIRMETDNVASSPYPGYWIPSKR